jgi:hypothetical protein
MSCAVGVVDGSDARAWSSDRRSALVASGVDGESYFALTPMAFVPVDGWMGGDKVEMMIIMCVCI